MMALLAALVIALPPLLVVTWLPFLDLVAYVGLNSFPAKLSSGPFHFAVFQLTYIIHYAITRLMGDLGISLPAQVKLLYLLQAGVSFFIIWRCLEDFIADSFLRCIGIALGALAFCDGLFIWGGPLAFSLAATALSSATFLTIREAESPPVGNGRVALLALLSVLCHPFALPFALLVGALRMVFVPAARIATPGWMIGLLALGWAIRNDSVETATTAQLTSMIALDSGEVSRRFTELFVADHAILRQLFGDAPGVLAAYLTLLGAIRFAGFITAPAVAYLAKDSPRLRALMVYETALAVLYFTSTNRSPIIPWWPQRILTFNSPFLLVAGMAGPIYLLQRYLTGRASATTNRRVYPAILWGCPVAILAALAYAQIPLLQFGGKIGASLDQTRTSLLKTQVSGAYLRASNLDAIHPFYLRCVPFLLFSDRELVAKNLILFTEWHDQLRHPTRLTENWFDLGRPRFLAQFSATNGIVDVRLEAASGQRFPLPTNIWRGTGVTPAMAQGQLANREGQLGYELLQAGSLRDAIEHFQTALHAKPDFTPAHLDLAVALARAGRVPEAIEHLGTAIAADPTNVHAAVNRALLLVSQNRNAEAATQLAAALRIAPTDPAANYLFGHLLAQEGKFAEASGHYRTAISANPQYFEAELNLGLLLLQQGQSVEARTHLNAAAKLRPNDENVRAALEQLRAK